MYSYYYRSLQFTEKIPVWQSFIVSYWFRELRLTVKLSFFTFVNSLMILVKVGSCTTYETNIVTIFIEGLNIKSRSLHSSICNQCYSVLFSLNYQIMEFVSGKILWQSFSLLMYLYYSHTEFDKKEFELSFLYIRDLIMNKRTKFQFHLSCRNLTRGNPH